MRKALLLALSIIVLYGCAEVRFNKASGGLSGAFRLSDAERVEVYPSSNGFKGIPAEESDGRWIALLPYEENFTYFLKVDGKLYTPDCDMRQRDDFGGEICIYSDGEKK